MQTTVDEVVTHVVVGSARTRHRQLLPDRRLRQRHPPDKIDEVPARYAAAAPRYGLEFFVDVLQPSGSDA
jgi:hypothetical protein